RGHDDRLPAEAVRQRAGQIERREVDGRDQREDTADRALREAKHIVAEEREERHLTATPREEDRERDDADEDETRDPEEGGQDRAKAARALRSPGAAVDGAGTGWVRRRSRRGPRDRIRALRHRDARRRTALRRTVLRRTTPGRTVARRTLLRPTASRRSAVLRRPPADPAARLGKAKVRPERGEERQRPEDQERRPETEQVGDVAAERRARAGTEQQAPLIEAHDAAAVRGRAQVREDHHRGRR